MSATYFHELRTGVKQMVSVDPRHAVLEFSERSLSRSFQCQSITFFHFEPESESWYTIDEQLVGADSIFDDLAGVYRAKDGGYVRIHTNFPQCVIYLLLFL